MPIRRVLSKSIVSGRSALLKQSTVPLDKNLGRVLGLQKSDRVLYFAGYAGNWARALSLFSTVTYTDISSKMAAEFRRGKTSHIKQIKVAAGETTPRKPLYYDWSISYEPHPMTYPSMALRTALTRALLNKKGAKIIMGTFVESLWRRATLFIEPALVAKTYGAEGKQELVKIIVASPSPGKRIQKQIAVFTLLANNTARKKAMLDLKIMKLTTQGVHEVEELAKKTKSTPQEIREGLGRLQKLREQPRRPEEDFSY